MNFELLIKSKSEACFGGTSFRFYFQVSCGYFTQQNIAERKMKE
jgi:hypothetical protein